MGSSTILHVADVDDDESLRPSLSWLLRAAGIEPGTYSSAQAVLSEPQHPQFDCLALDIQSGGSSGIELSLRCAQLAPTPAVIPNTVHGEPEVREQALWTNCCAYLRKSQPEDAVLAAIAPTNRSSPPET